MLARLTEKFYGSWAFKGLLAGIVCAVGLAAIGTVVIGTESYDLLKRVRDVGDAGEKAVTAAIDAGRKSVDDQVSAAKESLARRMDAAERLQDEAQAKATQFGKDVDLAAAQLKQARADFKKSLQEDLQAQVIAGLKAQIESPISYTRTEIENVRRDKFLPLQTTISNLDSSADKLDRQLRQIRVKIDPLTQLTDSVGPLADRVKEIRATAESAAQARADESAAQEAKQGAEAAREAIRIQVNGLAEQLPQAQGS